MDILGESKRAVERERVKRGVFGKTIESQSEKMPFLETAYQISQEKNFFWSYLSLNQMYISYGVFQTIIHNMFCYTWDPLLSNFRIFGISFSLV